MGKRPGVHFAFFLCCFYRRGYGVEGMRGQETASVALFCYFTSNVLGLLPPVCSTRPQSFSWTTSCQVFGGQLGKAPWHCTWRSPGVLPSRQNSVKLWVLGHVKKSTRCFAWGLSPAENAHPLHPKLFPLVYERQLLTTIIFLMIWHNPFSALSIFKSNHALNSSPPRLIIVIVNRCYL